MSTFRMIVIDDDPDIGDSIAYSLRSDFEIEVFTSAEEGLQAIQEKAPHIVLLDIELPGMSGIDALARINAKAPQIIVIMISGCDDIETVVAAVKNGAYDYIVKPLEIEALQLTLKNALKNLRLKEEVIQLQEKEIREQLPLFIGESSTIQEAVSFIYKIAQSPDTPVLILGETGTGKELLAKIIHYRSPRSSGPFIPVNCAAIPRELIESELFGYEKGAFTGAKTSGKSGLIEEAEEGSLFLDEVGDLSLEAQAKLLRFLESGEFYRVGGTKPRQVKTRVVSATNRDITGMIEQDRFRKDLFFRLGVIRVEVPPLNERSDCIMPLANHFLKEFNSKFGKSLTGINTAAQKRLTEHEWTGNVRELKNLIERAVLVGEGPEITPDDLGLQPAGETPHGIGMDPLLPPLGDTPINFKNILKSVETHYVSKAMKLAGGVERKAAKLLSMNHQTFRYHRQNLDKDKQDG